VESADPVYVDEGAIAICGGTCLGFKQACTPQWQTGMRVQNEAIPCGFGSASYFSKCFRRYFGPSLHMRQKSF